MRDTTPRRRGRPALTEDDTTVRVCVALPSRVYDVLYQRAQAARSSVPEQVRRVLRRVELKNTK